MAGSGLERPLIGGSFVVRRDPVIPGVGDVEKIARENLAREGITQRIRTFLEPYEAQFASLAESFSSERVAEEAVGISVWPLLSKNLRMRNRTQIGIQSVRELRGRFKEAHHTLGKDARIGVPSDDRIDQYPAAGNYHIDKKTGKPVFDEFTQTFPTESGHYQPSLHFTFSEGRISTIEYRVSIRRGTQVEVGISFDGNKFDTTENHYRDNEAKDLSIVLGAPRISLGMGSYYYFDPATATNDNVSGHFRPVVIPSRITGRMSTDRDQMSYNGSGPSLSVDRYLEEAKKLLDKVVPLS